MKNLHKYVPKKSLKLTYHLPEDFVCNEECYHRILFGGDQLTVSRSRGAQSIRYHDDDSEERLDGMIPVTEDWHARLTLMRVIIITIAHVKIIIHSPIDKQPKLPCVV